MRGADDRTGELFSYVDLVKRVRRDHPLRAIRAMVNAALAALEVEFAQLYAPIGRPSVPPEKLLRAMLYYHSRGVPSKRAGVLMLGYRRHRGTGTPTMMDPSR